MLWVRWVQGRAERAEGSREKKGIRSLRAIVMMGTSID